MLRNYEIKRAKGRSHLGNLDLLYTRRCNRGIIYIYKKKIVSHALTTATTQREVDLPYQTPMRSGTGAEKQKLD